MNANRTAAAVPFDPDRARHGLDCLNAVYAEWLDFITSHPPYPLPSAAAVEQARFRADLLAVNLSRWIRSVDDFLYGRDSDQAAAPGYVTERDSISGVDGQLLDGIAHAADKSLHRLVRFTERPPAVRMVGRGSLSVGGPPEPRPVAADYYWWPASSVLFQPISSGRKVGAREQAKRAGYDHQLAQQDLFGTLKRARTFLDHHRP